MPAPYYHGRQAESWWGSTVPSSQITLSAFTYIMAEFQFTVAGRLFGFRQYIKSDDGSGKWAVIWNVTSGGLAVVKDMFQGAPGSNGWRNCWIHPAKHFNAGESVRIAILSQGFYWRSNALLGSPVTHGHITAVNGAQTTSIDPYQATYTPNTNANGVDVLFQSDS